MKVNSRIINKLKKYMKKKDETEEKLMKETLKTQKKKTTEPKKPTKSKKKVLEPCGEGKYRNPDTNRCKLMTSNSKQKQKQKQKQK